jgi:hypothetical protein
MARAARPLRARQDAGHPRPRQPRAVAGFGRMLGMETIAWSQNLTPAAAAEAGCTFVERAELFRFPTTSLFTPDCRTARAASSGPRSWA